MTGYTHEVLAVLCEGGFDKESPEGEAQRAVCVADAQFPARSAALKHRTHIQTLNEILKPVIY